MTLTTQKIPMKKMFVESWRTLFKNRKAFLKVSLFWLGIFAALNILLELPTLLNLFEVPGINISEFFRIGIMGVKILMSLTILPMLMVLFIKSVAFKKPLPQKWFYFSFGRREWTYIFYTFLYFLLIGLTSGVVLLIPDSIFQIFFPELYVIPILGVVVGIFSFSYVSIRFSLVKAMAACGDSEGFIKSLKASGNALKGNILRFFIIIGLGAFCIFLPLFILMVSIELLTANGNLFLGLGLFLLFIAQTLLGFLMYGFYACFLGHIYALKRADVLAALKKIQ